MGKEIYYDTITFDATKKGQTLPPDLPLNKLKLQGRSTGWYGGVTDPKSLKSESLKSLEKRGITKLKDLEGISSTELEEVPGIGTVTIKRLLKAAKAADVAYRGTGWPYEVTANIQIPSTLVKVISTTLSKEEAEEAVSNLFVTNKDLLRALLRSVKAIKEEKIRQEQAELAKKLKEFSALEDELDQKG